MEKFLMFDFDGTIVNSRDLIIELYNEIAEREHYKKIDTVDIVGLSNISITDRCKRLNIPLHKIPFIALEVRKHYKKGLPNLKIDGPIAALLHRLKKEGFRLGIISSNDKSNIMEFLTNNELDIFECIFSEKNIFGKHHAINKFIKKNKLEIKDMIYIGDEVRDITACKKIGITVIAVTWGYDSLQYLLENSPDYVANNPKEIIENVNCCFEKE